MSKFWIVWNEGRNEGFVTDNHTDAQFAQCGAPAQFANSSAAEAFREIYDDEPLTIEEIELPARP